MQKAANGESGCGECVRSESEQHRQAALMLLSAADLPFSFLGDVVTWPYTAAYSFINEPVPTPPVLPVPDVGRPQAPLKPEKPEPDTETPAKDGGQGKPKDGSPPPMPMTLPRPKKENP